MGASLARPIFFRFFLSSTSCDFFSFSSKHFCTTRKNLTSKMPTPSIARFAHKYGVNSLVELPPAFLAPALYSSPLYSPSQRSKFSTTSHLSLKDKSKQRGISAIHRTGTRHPLSVSKYPLPTPEPIERQEKRPENPNHGLWEFFPENKQALPTPEEEYSHGM